MADYFSTLNYFLLLITAAGAGIPFIVWLLNQVVGKPLKNLAPTESYEAVVTSKRLEVRSKDSNKKAYTVYYMTFQRLSGERCEYQLPVGVYALSAEGDRGVLSVHMGKAISWKHADNENRGTLPRTP